MVEREADAFAGYALAPSPLITQYASENIADLMATFWISKECAEVRSSVYMNWKLYGGRYLKDHELTLVNLFK